MTRSSLTEETPATPGWVDARIKAIFTPLGDEVMAARDTYADCLAGIRGAVDVDAGHDRCRRALLQAVSPIIGDTASLDRTLQALEAEIATET